MKHVPFPVISLLNEWIFFCLVSCRNMFPFPHVYDLDFLDMNRDLKFDEFSKYFLVDIARYQSNFSEYEGKSLKKEWKIWIRGAAEDSYFSRFMRTFSWIFWKVTRMSAISDIQHNQQTELSMLRWRLEDLIGQKLWKIWATVTLFHIVHCSLVNMD
mgnify:CR=1 FL=1